MHLHELCPNLIWELSIPSSSTCIKQYLLESFALVYSRFSCFRDVCSAPNSWRTTTMNQTHGLMVG